jgi:cyd operon protein YbgT
MWYFSWVLGLGFAVTLAVLNAMWLEHRINRKDSADTEYRNADVR